MLDSSAFKKRALAAAVIVAGALAAVVPARIAVAGETRLLDARPRPADAGERAFFLASGATLEETLEFRDRLIEAGAWHVNLFLEERMIVCRMTPETAVSVPVPAGFRDESARALAPRAHATLGSEPWGWIVEAYDWVDRAPAEPASPGTAAGEPLDDVVLHIPPERALEIQRNVERALSLRSDAPGVQAVRPIQQNSEILTGTILANFIFPESNGQIDPSTEDWSANDMREAEKGSAGAFLAWQAWTQMDINATFNMNKRIPTGYEPIKHDMNTDERWIVDVMRGMGWGLRTNDSHVAVHEFNEAMRALYRTQWVVTSFIACARNVPNHRFGNGNAFYTAYAFLGGPYMLEPFPAGLDPNNIGETLVYSKIVQHEVGHLFWTLDEYPGAPGTCSGRSGYLNYDNGNITVTLPDGQQLRCEELKACIMHSAARLGQDRPWCNYSLGHLGVIDANANGFADVFEAAPEIVFEPEGPETVTTRDFTLRFRAVSRAVPNQNSRQEPGTRVDYAARLGSVRLSLGQSAGVDLKPVDGKMDGIEEEFESRIALAQGGQSVIIVRARNAFGYPAAPADFVKRIYFIGVNYSRVGASVGFDRIDVTWETAGEVFGAQFNVYRLDPGEALPGTKINRAYVAPESPGGNGFVPYRFIDRNVEPGRDYRYYVEGVFSLDIGGQPREYSSMSEVVTQTAAIPVPAGELVSGVSPNPTRGAVLLSIQVPRSYGGNPQAPQRLATPVTVAVYDVRGRRIRLLEDRAILDDVLTLRWDGTGTNDAPVPAGVYFVRIAAGGAKAVRKVVVVR